MRTPLALSSLVAVAVAQLKVDTFPDCKHGPLSNTSVCNMDLGKSLCVWQTCPPLTASKAQRLVHKLSCRL
jgi:hypothetical protein